MSVTLEPCPKCGSKNNLKRWPDGHAFCFSQGCEYKERATGERKVLTEERTAAPVRPVSLEGEAVALPARKIREDTCQHWNYRVGKYKGHQAQIAHYFDPETRKLTAAKLRFADKTFMWLGDAGNVPLYGQWLWKDGGKMVVVTEGEIDALTVSQLQGNKWPVVSIPGGAAGALKSIQKAIGWLERFDTVVFMFDMDEPGRNAARACAEVLTPGKAKIADLSLKDANECLKAGKGDEVINAIWNAKVFRPDGIVEGAAITRDSLKQACAIGYNLRYPRLNEIIGGIREREITLLTAGSGIGKSTFAREIAYGLHQDYGLTIGNVYLEESKEKTAQGYVAIDNNVPLGLLRKDPSILTDEEWDKSLNDVIHKGMYFYDHFGSLDSDHLISKLRYLRISCGCNFVILDHISIVVSGQESSSEGERKDIDRLMTKLRSLVEQTGLGIIAIVHLRQPEGKPHEEGGRVTLSQLRGSGSLKQLSDNVIALERNQQGNKSDLARCRVLKCREFGETGVADNILYNRITGRFLADNNERYVDEDDKPNNKQSYQRAEF
jgi:twinkle protein